MCDAGFTPGARRCYDFLLKFIIVGDADAGKEEILSCCEEDLDASSDRLLDCHHKTLTVLIDGNVVVRLFLWSGSGQGRFSTVVHSYSKGAHGVLLVFDITNKYSFASMRQWLREIDDHLPGIPKILLGNRLHLAFRRQVSESVATSFAKDHNLPYFEVSPLCNFNIRESLGALARLVLLHNRLSDCGTRQGLDTASAVFSLQELCARTIVSRVALYDIRHLPIPSPTRTFLASYALSYGTCVYTTMAAVVGGKRKKRYLNVSQEERKKTCVLS